MTETRVVLEKQFSGLLRDYERRVNKDLARHQFDDLFGRNVVAVQQDMLKTLSTGDLEGIESRQQIVSILRNLSATFVADALKHNRSSCAISNFPDQHNPSNDYVNAVWSQCEALLQVTLERLLSPKH